MTDHNFLSELDAHEAREESRFAEVREATQDNTRAIVLLQIEQARISTTIKMVGAAAMVVIPVLNQIVRVMFEWRK